MSFVVLLDQSAAPTLRLAFAGQLVVDFVEYSVSNALNLGRDNVEAWYREEEYSSTFAVNLLARAHLQVAVTMHEAHTARVAAVGDSVVVVVEVVVDIHCSGSSSPGLLEETRPRTGQPWR